MSMTGTTSATMATAVDFSSVPPRETWTWTWLSSLHFRQASTIDKDILLLILFGFEAHIIFPFSLFTDLQCFLSRQVRPFFIFTDSYEPYIVPPSSDLCRIFYWIGKEAELSTHQSWPGMRQRSRERWWRGSRRARSRRGKPRTHALRAPRAPACSDPGQRRSHGSGGRNIISHLWRVNQMNLYL